MGQSMSKIGRAKRGRPLGSRNKKRTLRSRARRSTLAPRQYTLNSVFPKTLQVKMPYVQHIALATQTAPAGTFNNFRCNSIHDPDATILGVGEHRPLGWNEWGTFYNHYTVKSSKITVTYLMDNSGTANDQIVFGIFKSDDSTVPTSATDLLEQPSTRYVIGNATNNLEGGGLKKVNHSFNARSDFNVSKVMDNQKRIGGLFGANPEEQMFWHVFAYNLDTLVDVPAVKITVDIVYTCEFGEAKEIAQST